MVKQIVSDVAEKFSSFTSHSSSSVPSSHAEKHDSGITSPKIATGRHTHILATPTTPSATPSLPTASDISTTSSSYQGVSSVWLQLLVSRGVLHLYGRDDACRTAHPSSQKDRDNEISVRRAPARAESLEEKNEPFYSSSSSASSSSPPLKVSVEVESLSLQVDVQERCTDFILKVAGVESDFCTLSKCSSGSNSWVPYLIHSKGKLFSSVASNLPDDILQVTAPGFSANQFQSSGQGIGADVYSPCRSPKLHSSFVYIKGYVPTRFPRVPRLEVTVRPFEVVVWLPVIGLMLSIIGSRSESDKTPPTAVRLINNQYSIEAPQCSMLVYIL